MTRVTVVGSANVDTTLRVHKIPAPGETVMALTSSVQAGGKGLNQAVAAHRGGVDTSLVAAVGTDAHSEAILDVLASESIGDSLIRRVAAPTGSAVIAVEAAGENTIIVTAGANDHLVSLEMSDLQRIAHSRVVLCQLEVPFSVVAEAAYRAREAGAVFMLNPSPVNDFPREFLLNAGVVTVNEHESSALGIDRLGLECVITTLGSRGAIVARKGRAELHIPSRDAVAVDTTGAGDTFVGVVAAELALGADIVAAARRAVVAASLAVESAGAVPSIPNRGDVDRALALVANHTLMR